MLCMHLHFTHNTDFLVWYRNIFEAYQAPNGESWTKETVSTPLESDEIAMEYLARFGYDVRRAIFKLTCDLGSGKGNQK